MAELLFCMFAVTERFQMETQPQLLLLQKTMVVIEGVARELSDQANIWMLARPLVSEWTARHMGPIGRVEAVGEEVHGQLRRWMALPERIELVLGDIENGRVSMSPESVGMAPVFGGLLLSAAAALLAWALTVGASSIWVISGAAAGMGLGLSLLLARR